jgi:hypothetical protein
MNPNTKGISRQSNSVFVLEVNDFRDILSVWKGITKSDRRKYVYDIYDKSGSRRPIISVKCGTVEKRFYISPNDDRLQEILHEAPNSGWEKLKKIPFDTLCEML